MPDTDSVNSNQSEGPITPETKAIDPGTEVPDLDLGEVVSGSSSMRFANAEIGSKLKKPFTKLCAYAHVRCPVDIV
jgi:hypothetical protein